MKQPKKVLTIYLVMFFLFLFACLPRISYTGDMRFWSTWMEQMNNSGLGDIYNYNRAEYPPVFMYMLWTFQQYHQDLQSVHKYLEYVKLFPLLFDIAGALLIFFFIKINWKNIHLPFLALFNVGYIYNTVLWGQVDAIHTFFSALSLILMLKGRVTWSLIALVFALNTKLQSIIFVPVIGLVFLFQIFQHPKKLTGIIWVILVQFTLLLPFIIGGSFQSYLKVILGATSVYPTISMNAFNVWDLLGPDGYLFAISDQDPFWGLTYRSWGFIFFFSMSFIVLFPLLKKSIYYFKNKLPIDRKFQALALLSGGMVAVVFFYFNTQMHERYVHPALLFFFLYGVICKRYYLFIMISIVYMMNLERVFKAFDLNNYGTFIFDRSFLSLLFLITLGLAILEGYRLMGNNYTEKIRMPQNKKVSIELVP